MRMLIAQFTQAVIAGALDQEGDLSAKRQLVLEVSATVSQVGRRAGYYNDIERFEAIDGLELEDHGTVANQCNWRGLRAPRTALTALSTSRDHRASNRIG